MIGFNKEKNYKTFRFIELIQTPFSARNLAIAALQFFHSRILNLGTEEFLFYPSKSAFIRSIRRN